MLESEIKKVKRFIKMLMTIQEESDLYFVMEFTKKQSFEFQMQNHCEKGRAIQLEQNNKTKEFNTFTAHNLRNQIQEERKKESVNIKIKVKKDGIEVKGINDYKWLKQVRKAIVKEMKRQGRIQEGMPGMMCSMEVNEINDAQMYDDMSGKLLDPRGVEKAREEEVK